MNVQAGFKPWNWLIAWDFFATLVLGLGLHVHYAPGTTAVAGLLAPFRLPLLVGGGLMMAAGGIAAVALTFRTARHRRPG